MDGIMDTCKYTLSLGLILIFYFLSSQECQFHLSRSADRITPSYVRKLVS